MEMLEVPLSEAMKKFIDLQVAAKGFANPSDYIAHLIEAAKKKEARERIESLLVEGLRSEASEMTPQDWEEIRQEGLKRLAKSKRS